MNTKMMFFLSYPVVNIMIAGSSLLAYVIKSVKESHPMLTVEKIFSVLILCQLKSVVT
jgi:hypothetical protein